MSTKLMTANVNEIKERLNIRTEHLGRFECEKVRQLLQELNARLACEQWGHEHGWDIPVFGTPEWLEMQTAYIEDFLG